MTSARTHGAAAAAASTISLPMVLALGLACGDDTTQAGGSSGAASDAATAAEATSPPDGTSSTTTETSTTGETEHGALERLELTPAEQVLAVDLGAAAALELTAVGHYEDGAIVDVTAAASFVLAEPRLGTMDGSTLELTASSETFAAVAHVTATLDDQAAEASILVVAHPRTGPAAQALFVLPYQRTGRDPAGPSVQPLVLGTEIERLDVVVSMEATGAMGGPIAELQASLVGTVIPGLQAAVADAGIGLAAFMDYPIAPFGIAGCDQPFVLLQAVTSSTDAAQAAALELTDGPFGGPIGCGGDAPASHLEALWQLATGAGLDGPAPTFVAQSDVGRGGAGFREGALPVIVSVTAARSHDPAGSTCDGLDYDADPAVATVAASQGPTEAALASLCGRVVTMAISGFDPTCSPLADGLDLAAATGAVVHPAAWDLAPGGRPPGCAADQCCTGQDGTGVASNPPGRCALAHRIPFGGGGLGERIVDAAHMVARAAPFDVSAVVHGTPEGQGGAPLPPGLDTSVFITSTTPLSSGPVPLAGVAAPILTPTGFVDVVPGTTVTFEVAGTNDLVPPTDVPQLFVVEISARADGCIDLDARELLVLVPPIDWG